MKRTLFVLALCSVSGLALSAQQSQPRVDYFAQGQQSAQAGLQFVQQGIEAGRRARQQQVEHEAQVRLLEAQAEAARAQAEAARVEAEASRAATDEPAPAKQTTPARPRLVVYMCSRPGEASVFTQVPEVGCIVSAVEW